MTPRFNALTASQDEAINRARETGKMPYTVERGLRNKMVNGEPIAGYVESLPRFDGANLQELIEARISQEAIRITDVGYGAGQFMLDVTQEYPNVNCIGFGRAAFTQMENKQAGMVPTYSALMAEERIELIEGDLPIPEGVIAPGTQDIITINNVWQYLPPEIHLVVLTGVAQRLKVGGVALINRIELDDTKKLLEALEEGGIKVKMEIAESTDPEMGKTLAFGRTG